MIVIIFIFYYNSLKQEFSKNIIFIIIRVIVVKLNLVSLFVAFSVSHSVAYICSMIFIASDSVLAYNNFNAPSANDEQFIMFTYILAQVLIVAGFLY